MTRASKPVRTRLTKDLVRDIKRGHAWLYSHAVRPFDCEPGSVVHVYDRKGDRLLASGICDPGHAIPIRICRTQPSFDLGDPWLAGCLDRALVLRRAVFDETTTGYRLVAGEGDDLPGLIVDVYDSTAVIKLDGGAPRSFYQLPGLAEWLRKNVNVDRVVHRPQERGAPGRVLIGDAPDTISFLENGLLFSADVIRGQKTGFFLDQRDNRNLVRRVSAGRTVLNLFSFNGGFSIAAGMGGARHVTSVDIAPQAIEAAGTLWEANGLDPSAHEGVVCDGFEYLEQAASNNRTWDIVICDPPSFAPNEKSRPAALAAYEKLARAAAKVTAPEGLLALASCSSHVDRDAFLGANSEGLGRSRRKGRLLSDNGLPLDHPTPLAMSELRYLKFQLFQLD